ncbi:eukaryotic translation initiation factor 4 gamma 3-like [Platichthys flesus]|uniref:eukaryotic translation initiation factor 4 gamma 3-like n=1 Tax=Platichthys flesus TaxID=8260 RepID=UPI002DC04079|nr:eukaryotic translation initiation factor 4 gamma 3-like [Platichthys flesus]
MSLFVCVCVFLCGCVSTDPSEQKYQGVQGDEPGNTVPKKKDSRTTVPNKKPTFSEVINRWAQRPQPREIIVSLSVDQVVKPKTSENALTPGRNREIQAEPKSKGTQDLFKKVRSILDKRTPYKFNQLMKLVTDVTIDTEERLKGVVDLVFEKAIDEPVLSVAYGNMCSCLAELKVPISDEPNSTVSFIKLLLSRCQQEFQKDNEDDDVVIRTKQKKLDSAARKDRHRLLLELQEFKDIIRRRSIGFVKFIGELFKLKKLKAPVMHDCVVKLLQNQDNVSLECLCSLLTTIGKEFDLKEAKPQMDEKIQLGLQAQVTLVKASSEGAMASDSAQAESEESAEGVALKSVTAFFTWLREAEQESEDN